MILRPATEEDDAGMRAVIGAAFPDNPKQRQEITAWQYWGNPFGRTVAYVWEDDGRIVATYTSFPMPAVLGGQPGLAANGVDAAVDPAYQGKRLFSPLAEALYAGSGEAGMAVTMCFINNPVAIKGTTRAGWLEVGRLGVWVQALDDAWLAKPTHIPRPAIALAIRATHRKARVKADRTDGVPRGIDDLWERSGAVTTGVARTQAWWDWRYGQQPDHPYVFFELSRGKTTRAAAVATMREAFGGRFLYLLELLADDAPAARSIAAAAADYGREQGATGVALMGLPGSRVTERARQAGFIRVPKRLDPKPTSFGAVPNTKKWSHLQALDWSVSWGDLDHL